MAIILQFKKKKGSSSKRNKAGAQKCSLYDSKAELLLHSVYFLVGGKEGPGAEVALRSSHSED